MTSEDATTSAQPTVTASPPTGSFSFTVPQPVIASTTGGSISAPTTTPTTKKARVLTTRDSRTTPSRDRRTSATVTPRNKASDFSPIPPRIGSDSDTKASLVSVVKSTTETCNGGTLYPPYTAFIERETNNDVPTVVHFVSITANYAYRNWSFEELRVSDYLAGRKYSTKASVQDEKPNQTLNSIFSSVPRSSSTLSSSTPPQTLFSFKSTSSVEESTTSMSSTPTSIAQPAVLSSEIKKSFPMFSAPASDGSTSSAPSDSTPLLSFKSKEGPNLETAQTNPTPTAPTAPLFSFNASEKKNMQPTPNPIPGFSLKVTPIMSTKSSPTPITSTPSCSIAAPSNIKPSENAKEFTASSAAKSMNPTPTPSFGRQPQSSPSNVKAPSSNYESILHSIDRLNVSDKQKEPSRVPSISEFLKASIVKPKGLRAHGMVLANQRTKSNFEESSFLGMLVDNAASGVEDDGVEAEEVFLNVHEPFCLVALGVQGAGKSHTMSVILENCLLSTRNQTSGSAADRGMIDVKEPMCALVLHYDQNPHSLCESTGLINPAAGMVEGVPRLLRERMTVLVSPSYFKQRRDFYGSYCDVRPLLFSWNSLSADHIKKLMRVDEEGNQLYMATLLELLRNYQRADRKPDFRAFLAEVKEASNAKNQEAPLIQRLNILQSFIIESEKNSHIRHHALDLGTLVQKGNLIVVDLTDPMLSASEVNGVFQLLVEKFRVAPLTNGSKVLALDEVHKFMDGNSSDGLSAAILDTVRLMRHDGIRVVLSTQSPRALLPEILELVSVAVMHRFHSRDWFSYLRAKIPLEESDFDKIVELEPGEAVVFAGRHLLEARKNYKEGDKEMKREGKQFTFKIGVRPRLTADRGSSRMNK
ncbi:hypothetical protein BCR33DRAFT_762168 [Rhizoclosmatium globosum]|uniref:P-loop containing nucleoside triphosphate hydrolase protein n=1 Tax=Rhizoclosmatium globosum TaxID=329046 RepID=A0A1Y2CWK1_9FUNG|nr:hypothetical protein BCR33DRAFT_762168 [Rhizoclosmatium globosum]|eukprot:ORY51411.1 hypothetical protein BCR33DRAFT_762168 [Rhizoclosmatium globosum]